MSGPTSVAHRAAPPIRGAVYAALALAVALVAIFGAAGPAAAAGYAPRVVVVVGPSGASTDKYLDRANLIASQAAAYGASVTKIYTPNATWTRVLAAAQGANLFVYLGHGNGWPSPYGPYQGLTKDGLGLNPYAGSGLTTPVKYYGEDLIAAKIRFAPGAVVILNHLCYASGNGEPGSSEPSWDTARKRVDNYAAGFLRARAAAVLADGHTNLGYEIASLFGAAQPILRAWRNDPDANGHERSFASVRTPGFTDHLDPDNANSSFYRSLVTKSTVSTRGIRIAAWRASPTADITLRLAASGSSEAVGSASEGQRLYLAGAPFTDEAGRTWMPVMTLAGVRAWAAGWLLASGGSAVPTTSVVLRLAASTSSAKLGTIKAGTRVTITKSARDRSNRAWVGVRTPSGATGWVAAWLLKP